MGSNMSNYITQLLIDMLDDEGSAEIKRNDFAQSVGCVPSQINYVISSRFTPENGYIVESRRGGGGYIKITRLTVDTPSAIMHTVNTVGNEIDGSSCRYLVTNLALGGYIDRPAAKLMLSATDEASLRVLPPEYRGRARASILKQMLLAYGKDD